MDSCTAVGDHVNNGGVRAFLRPPNAVAPGLLIGS